MTASSDEEELFDIGLTSDHASLINHHDAEKDDGDILSRPTPVENKKVLKTVVLFASFISLGLAVAILGPTIPNLILQVGTGYSQLSFIFLTRGFGYMVGAVVSGFLIERWNPFRILGCSLALCAVAMFLMPAVESLSMLILLFILAGFAMGSLDTGGNVLCIKIWGSKSAPYMQALHFSFAIGALVAPLLAKPFISLPFSGNETSLDFVCQKFETSHSLITEQVVLTTTLPSDNLLTFTPPKAVTEKEITKAPTIKMVPTTKQIPAKNTISSTKLFPRTEPLVTSKSTPVLTKKPVTTTEQTFTTEPVSTTKQVLTTEPVTTSKQVLTTEPVSTTKQVLTTEPVTTPEQVNTPEQVLATEEVNTSKQVLTTEEVNTSEQVLTTEEVLTTEQDTTLAPVPLHQITTNEMIKSNSTTIAVTSANLNLTSSTLSTFIAGQISTTENEHVETTLKTTEGKTPAKKMKPAAPRQPNNMSSKKFNKRDTRGVTTGVSTENNVEDGSKLWNVYGIIFFVITLNSIAFFYLSCRGGNYKQSHYSGEKSLTHQSDTTFRLQLLSIMFVFYFLYVGSEVAYGSFIFSYGKFSDLKLSTDQASLLNSLYWGMFALFRGIAIILARCTSPLVMLLVDLLGCGGAALTLLIFRGSNALALWVGTALLGASMASLFPSGLSWLEQYIKVTGTAASVLVVGASAGEMAIPFAVGHFFPDFCHSSNEGKNIQVLMYTMFAVTLFTSIIFSLAYRLAKRRGARYKDHHLVPESSMMLELQSTD